MYFWTAMFGISSFRLTDAVHPFLFTNEQRSKRANKLNFWLSFLRVFCQVFLLLFSLSSLMMSLLLLRHVCFKVFLALTFQNPIDFLFHPTLSWFTFNHWRCFLRFLPWLTMISASFKYFDCATQLNSTRNSPTAFQFHVPSKTKPNNSNKRIVYLFFS